MPHIGPLAVSVSGTCLLPAERELLASEKVGMVVLFKENWDITLPAGHRKAALKELISEIHAINPAIVTSVDHEGGRVWRFREEFTMLPPAKSYGGLYNIAISPEEKQNILVYVFNQGKIMAEELLACNIDISLTPVLDIDAQSDVIGKLGRAFHADPKIVTVIARAFIKGMKAAGMPATGKHFPGHGFCKLDSHIAIPTDSRSLDELEIDLAPFKILLEEGLLDALMMAHIIFPQVDKDHTAGASTVWRNYIRETLGGDKKKICVMSDCLRMAGAGERSVLDRLTAAYEGGCHYLMITHQQGAALHKLMRVLHLVPDNQESAQRRVEFAMKSYSFASRMTLLYRTPALIFAQDLAKKGLPASTLLKASNVEEDNTSLRQTKATAVASIF